LGTAGGVLNNSWFLKDTFIILSGDGLMDINLTQLITFHKQKGGIATIALKRVEEVSQYGVVVTDQDNRIVAFQEKPKPQEALSNLVNTGSMY
jgi:mannose-1-phosphate guanylyltransferase